MEDTKKLKPHLDWYDIVIIKELKRHIDGEGNTIRTFKCVKDKKDATVEYRANSNSMTAYYTKTNTLIYSGKIKNEDEY